MRRCEACGAEVPAGAAFCGQCGHRLQPAKPPLAPAEPPLGPAEPPLGPAEPPLAPAMSTHTATATFRAERKVVTILFADIKGSLAIIAGQDPEHAGDILANVVACMAEAVRRHAGIVNQVMGDGIMALFGAPIAMEDHAAQACLAALAMRVAVQHQVRPSVHVRVGLGSGEVVVRGVPGDVGLHYSAAGEAVHLASRMEQAAAPDQILLTDFTRHLAAAAIETRPIDVVIKGAKDASPVFELLGMRATPPAHVPNPRRIIGRDRELDLLRRARDHAAAGDGQAIRLVGAPGSGKSRLLREFTGAHLHDGWQICDAAAVSHRRTSYGVVSDLLLRLFALNPEDEPPARREKVAAGLALPAHDQNSALVPLSALLNLQTVSPDWTALDAWERRERTIAATVQAFQRLSERRPLALAVEDAHWLDAESATSIQRIGATATGRRLLSVITARGNGDTGAWADASWQDCPVGPLNEDGTLQFLRSRLLPGPDVAALERKLIEHTSGNPLFLEECLQALVETGELLREDDRFRLVAPIPVLRVPNSLRGLLDARVDRLGNAEKDVLQAASVVGSQVPLDLLNRAVDLDPARLGPVLARLVDAGFLLHCNESHYAFRHGLIREAAYSGILKRSRARMHGAVLDALERRPGPAEPIVDLLANHAVAAETWPKAAIYAHQAAARAYDRYANPEAMHYYDHALTAARNLPPGPEQDRTLLDLHIAARYPLFRLGNVTALTPHLDEAVRLAATQDGHQGLGQALIMRSHVNWLRGEPREAITDATTAQTLATRHDDPDLAIRARFQLGLVALSQGDNQATIAHMAALIDHMGPTPTTKRYGLDARLVVNAYGYAARAHAAAGALPAARAECDAALTLAAALDERQTSIYAHLADGVVSLAEACPERALAAFAQADEFCRGADVRLLSPVAAGFLAEAYLAAGQPAAALPIARQAVEDAERMGFLALHPLRLNTLAEALLATGQPAAAATTAQAAQQLAHRLGEQAAEAAAASLLARALSPAASGA